MTSDSFSRLGSEVGFTGRYFTLPGRDSASQIKAIYGANFLPDGKDSSTYYRISAERTRHPLPMSTQGRLSLPFFARAIICLKQDGWPHGCDA